jgi:hypothetical protein
MDAIRHHPPITLRPLSAQQFRVAMGLAIAGLPYGDIEQLTPRTFGLTLRSGRPAAFHVSVHRGEAGIAQLVIGATLMDDTDSREALAISSQLMATLPSWCDRVWATGLGAA